MYALLLATESNVRAAFLLLILAMLIDATDGILARRVKVKEVLPHFDGAMIDNVIDVLNYVWVPVFIMVSQDLLPNPLWMAVPILAAMYAYGQVDMKTEDAFFLGFPSYWNIIALYMFWLSPGPLIAVLLVVAPAILTFVPTRYLYPSRNDILWKTSWGLGIIWFAMIIYLLFQKLPNHSMISVSLFYPAYYMIASFYVDWSVRHRQPR